MNIMMFTQSLCMDGVTTCVIEFSNGLCQKGHQVWVCGRADTENYRLIEGVKFVEIDFYTKSPPKILANIKKLYKLIRSKKIDIIHCHWRFTAQYARILHWITGVKVIWQNHLIPIPCDFIHRITTYYGKKAIAISYDGSIFLHDKLKIPKKKIAIINNGIDINKYQRLSDDEIRQQREKYHILPEEKVIVLFARLAPVKGHKFLIDALREYRDENYKVLFTGESEGNYKAELEQYIHDAGIERQIIFTGKVAANDVLSIADVMVLPSEIEGFPISVIESFVLRVPVIRTKEGGYEDMKDCVDGVQYGDKKTLAELIKRNLEYGKDVSNRVERAYRKTIEKWNLDTVIESYISVYKG